MNVPEKEGGACFSCGLPWSQFPGGHFFMCCQCEPLAQQPLSSSSLLHCSPSELSALRPTFCVNCAVLNKEKRLHPQSHMLTWSNICRFNNQKNKASPTSSFSSLVEWLCSISITNLYQPRSIAKAKCVVCSEKNHTTLLHIPNSSSDLGNPSEKETQKAKFKCIPCYRKEIETGGEDDDIVVARCFAIGAPPAYVFSAGEAAANDKGAWCDLCGVNIIGASFKSTSVPDYDICEACAISNFGWPRSNCLLVEGKEGGLGGEQEACWCQRSHRAFLWCGQADFFSSFALRPRPEVPTTLLGRTPLSPSAKQEYAELAATWEALPLLPAHNTTSLLGMACFPLTKQSRTRSVAALQRVVVQVFDASFGSYAVLHAGVAEYSSSRSFTVTSTQQQYLDWHHGHSMELSFFATQQHPPNPAQFLSDVNPSYSTSTQNVEAVIHVVKMPFVEAGSLEHVMSSSHRHYCEEKHMVAYLQHVIRAVADMHKAGLVHGALRLDNCFTNTEGEIILGIPAAVELCLHGVPCCAASGCRGLVVSGVADDEEAIYRFIVERGLRYLAPEVAVEFIAATTSNNGTSSMELTQASDVYALGAMAAHIVSSRPAGDTLTLANEELLLEFAKNPAILRPTFLPSLLPSPPVGEKEGKCVVKKGPFGHSASVVDLIERMMSVDPELRPSCEEVLQHDFFQVAAASSPTTVSHH